MLNSTSIISCQKFAQFLVNQEPIYDKLIIRDIRPEDSWIGHVATGRFEAFSGTEHTFDRFRSVFPNVTKEWNRVESGSCIGTPCDKTEHRIGWGYDRNTYFLEEQSWATDLLCFDQLMHITHAKEHFNQIIGDILRPATSWIMSHFLRKRAADHAGKKWLAALGQPDFTYTWESAGDDEIYINVSGLPTSKLTPQMLQRRVHPLMSKGYMGKQPFKDMPPLIELVTDMETTWDLDKAASDPLVNGNWRFQDWAAANKYYRYAFSGQMGNYAIRVDPFPLRFNKVSATKLQLVLPYKNTAATEGIGSEENPDFANAQYQFSIIHHRMAIIALTADDEQINSEMPFAKRDFGGKWKWVQDNLGVAADGCVIENKRRNKGQFIADFKLAIKPQYVEFEELIFHKREPAFVVVVDTAADDPGYPTQSYDSVNDACDDDTVSFTPTLAAAGGYRIAANTIKCNGVPIVHAAVGGAGTLTLADLVIDLNDKVAILGTWSEDVAGTGIEITDTSCTNIEITWTA